MIQISLCILVYLFHFYPFCGVVSTISPFEQICLVIPKMVIPPQVNIISVNVLKLNTSLCTNISLC